MKHKIYGLCEAAILVLLGAAIIWFALSGHYGLLMNVKFRWLTVTGAVLLLVMGLFALGGLQKRPGPNTFIFGLMLLVVSMPAMIIITPRETDMGYGFIIFITVAVPGVFVISTGMLALLIGMGVRMAKKRKTSKS